MPKGESSSVRKATSIFRGKKKERSQPAKRAKLGLLEKHKDYVERARNFHAKEKRIAALQAKADMRNTDEFYFKMQSSKTKNGVAEMKKLEKGLDMDSVKILKGQDLGYVTMKATAEKVKVDKMSSSLQFIGVAKPKSHIVFVDTEEEAESFDAAEHFNTAPELVDRHFNRPTTEQLRAGKLIKRKLSKKELNKVESAKAAAYTELVRPSFIAGVA